MMIEPLVYIVLVNYNGYKDTLECIKSLNQINYKNFKIIVVDNQSLDDSVSELRKRTDIILIESKINLGFSGGNNLGIEFALKNGADYVLLLNNDTVVDKNFLNELVQVAIKDKKIGVLTGKIYYYDHPNLLWFAGGQIKLLKSVGIHYDFNKSDSNQNNDPKYITFSTGCLQLISKEVFDKVGLYDSDYFLYIEDLDFCYRVLKAKYLIKYIPTCIIYHKVSSSTGNNSPTSLYYGNRNRMLFVKKNVQSKIKRFFIYTFLLVTRPLLVIKYKSKIKFVIMGLRDFFKNKVGKSLNK